MLEAAQQSFKLKAEKQLLAAAREGDIEGLKQLVLSINPPNINCSDANGNTPLHCASYRDHKEAAVLLLQCGIDSNMKNSRGQTALDLAQTAKMKQLLDVKPVKTIQKSVDMFEGQLMKKAKFLGGWKFHWVVVDKGVISYFKRRADAVSGVKRQGYKYLNQAKFKICNDSTSFAVQYADRSTHLWSVVRDDQSFISRQKWLNILYEHCEYSNHYTKSEPLDDEDMEDLKPLGCIQDVLQVANAHQNLLEQQVEGLQKFLDQQNIAAAQQKSHSLKSTSKYQSSLPLAAEIRQLLQQLVYSSKEMYSSMTHCLNIMTQQEELRKLQLEQETEKSRVLEDALHVLAKEHHTLEEKLAKRLSSSSPLIFDGSDDVFCDAEDLSSSDADSFHSMSDLMDGMPGTFNQLTISETTKAMESQQDNKVNEIIKTIPSEPHRTNLPSPMIKRDQFSLWTVLKQCIGKELSKMTMPVVFNEPLSFLQRFSEYVEYADLLDKAGKCDDVVDRMKYIATFIVSSGASNIERVSKPFNPLLGETFELTWDNYGLRQISEQVSHHPPISAFHASANNFEFHGSVNPKLKFWGKSLEVTPKGVLTVDLPRYEESYTWHSISSAVHNLIVGKVWIEQYGHMEIINHKTGHRCFLHFKPAGWFSKDIHKVEGYIVDKQKKKICYLFGNWTEYFYSMGADEYEQAKKAVREEKGKRRHSRSNPGSPTAVERGPGGIDNLDFGINPEGPEFNSATLIWRVTKRPENSSQYYSFTSFALQLNNLTPEIKKIACPTDARLRPDIRHLENGDIDSASDEKHRLEEKQRAARKLRNKLKETWRTRWFRLDTNLHTGEPDWVYNGKYWARDYSDCPDVF
ncbi:oxysterol-binding protein-related protein 2-like isoform X2 [Anneissia japonica]|nr:oxysterol-binding protein-related protein 2-like isoform X2 [Anneissia japonica]